MALLTIEEARAQVGLTESYADEYLETAIAAAESYVESYTGYPLETKTATLQIDCFPLAGEPIEVEKKGVTSIGYIQYINTDLANVEVEADNYYLSASQGSFYPSVKLWEETVWATDQHAKRKVVDLEYTQAVPVRINTDGVKMVIKQLVGFYYESRTGEDKMFPSLVHKQLNALYAGV